jgi:hypothetical protein
VSTGNGQRRHRWRSTLVLQRFRDFLAQRAMNSGTPARNFNDLFLVNSWIGSVALIVAGLVVLFFAFGFWWPYWRIFDMDFWMVYEAWLFNDGLPQEWFDHPGYLTILLLGQWYDLLHHIGLLDVHALSGLPALPTETGHAWVAAVRAGRVQALLISIAFVIGFGALLWRLIGDWRIAILATFLLAYSGGLAIQSRIIRTELIAAGGVFIALLMLLIAARTPRAMWRPFVVGLAACCATLGLVNKVQVIFLICALPIVVLPFGCRSEEPPAFWQSSRLAWPANALIAVCAVLLAIPAASLVWLGISQASSIGMEPIMLKFGVYQAIIALWSVGSMIAFAIWWRVAWPETFAAMMCVLAGISLALLSLDIRYNPQNVIAVVNPLEQLLQYAKMSNAQIDTGAGAVKELIQNIGIILVTRTFILDSSARPTIFLEWFVIAAAFFAWKDGNRMLVARVGVLMCVAWGIDVLSTARGLKQQYFILSEPLVVIATALLLANLPWLRAHPRAYQVSFLLIAVHVVLGQAEPVKQTFRTSIPFEFCVDHFIYTQRIERFPYCPPAGGDAAVKN